MALTDKGRIIEVILYPDNMVDDWQDIICDKLQIPFAYCVHDGEVDKSGNPRKVHVHLILVFNAPTTIRNAIAIANKLSNGNSCCSTGETVSNIRSAYNYLIHDTDECRKNHKKLFNVEDRIVGNGFDIGFLEQTSESQLQNAYRDIMKFIKDNGITNFADVTDFGYAQAEFITYEKAIQAWSHIFQREVNGQWQRSHGNRESNSDF